MNNSNQPGNLSEPSASIAIPLPPLQDELVIDNIETLRAISDPLRLRIIELLAEPRTVKEIAAKLEIGKTKLYYHLNLLEKHGILRVVSTRVVSGIIEKSYQVAAMRFRPASELLLGSEEGNEQGLAIVDTIFAATRKEIGRGFKAQQLGLGAEAGPKRLFIGHTIMRLTPAQVEDFYTRFEALLAEVSGYDISGYDISGYDNAKTDARTYALTMAFFPKIEEKE